MTGDIVGHSSLLDRSMLIVDDEVELRVLLSSTLSRWGFRVDVATHGIDALECLSKRSYDVILTDIQMPHMDGVTLWRRALAAGHPGVWILMTGSAPPPLGETVPVLFKPFRLVDLRALLTHALPSGCISLT